MQNISTRAAVPCAANDNEPTINEKDPAVFDACRLPIRLVESRKDLEWSPTRTTVKLRGKQVFTAADGPDDEHRIRAQAAWCSSQRFSGQHANDNQDWPLAKLLKAEGHDHCLALAERYRDLFDAANSSVDLIGKDMADNIYLMHRTDLDESTGKLLDKGAKKVAGKKARLDMHGKQSAKPIPKKWSGDWPLLHRIDANRELALAQAALGWLREALEAAVVGGEKLETIGRGHGARNPKGANGAGRALVFLGFQALDEFWQRRRIAA
ncbi:hypothetical protein [Chelativorans alearense]|uniref:hypothetical protein n=1 Tax=Chelativorans alearense TaxID=2681495 RepID=UPI0013D2513C|nr:hypothetical protein [Chelativorans alearense]